MLTLEFIDLDIYLLLSSENYVKLSPSVKMASTLRSQTQFEASTSISTSSIETRTTVSACSTCYKMSLSRGDMSSPRSTSSPLSSVMEHVPNTGKLFG